MTTIAFRDGILAGDTRICSDDRIEPGHARKVFRLRNGVLVGFAGTLALIQSTLAALRKSPDSNVEVKVDEENELHALIIYPNGRVRELDSAGWTEVKAKYHAIGSGSRDALVAMECGKTAAEAVRVAMRFDTNTGGKVQTVSLKKKVKR